MEQISERRNQISQYLRPYMEECFQESCDFIQKKLESHGSEIWTELKSRINKCLNCAAALQEQQEKGALQYLVFSFMQYGIYLDGLEMRIDALDDRFYLDEQEAAEYYRPVFLQEKYIDDLVLLQKKAGKKFIRLQNYERIDIKRGYVHYYQSILFRMIESLATEIMTTITDSGILIADHLKVIFGEYMDNAIAIF